jgi:hypothetical protein
MTQQTILQAMTKTFEDLGLYVTVPPEEPNLPFNGIIVEFGMDQEERPIVLQVLQYTKETAGFLKEGEKEETTAELNIVSFILTIPIEVQNTSVDETLKLLALINKALPLGAFNYSDVEKAVYYSYNLPLFLEPPLEMILLTILQTLVFVKDTFIPVIENVAEGKETVGTFLELLSGATAAK